MKSNKILVAFVIVLIIINCVLLSLFWFNIYPIKRRPPIQGPAFEYLSRELKLTPAQKGQYEKMRDAHRQFTDSLNTQTRMMRDSFFDQLKDPSAKPGTINALEKKISDNTAKLDTSTFYHFRRFRAILSPGQQQRFDEVIQDVLRSMGSPPPPQGGPRTGMPGGPPQGAPPPNGMPHPRDRKHWGPPPYGRRPGPGMPPPPNGGPPPPYGPPPNGGPPPYGPPPGGGPPPNGGPPPPNGGPTPN